MAILNEILRAEGNKSIPATANIITAPGYLKDGDSLQTNVETFGADGGSLGIQGLILAVDNTIDGYEPDYGVGNVGGVTLYNFMRHFCRLIQNGWTPTVTCYAAETSNNTATFHIKPLGDDGAKFPATVSYELVRIRDWVFIEI